MQPSLKEARGEEEKTYYKVMCFDMISLCNGAYGKKKKLAFGVTLLHFIPTFSIYIYFVFFVIWVPIWVGVCWGWAMYTTSPSSHLHFLCSVECTIVLLRHSTWCGSFFNRWCGGDGGGGGGDSRGACDFAI